MLWRYAILLLVLMLGSGCGGAVVGAGSGETSVAEPGSEPPTTTVLPPSPAPSGSETAAATTPAAPVTTASPSTMDTPAPVSDRAVLAIWTRSGGFIGATDMMMVYGDGTVEVNRDGEMRSAPGDPAALQALEQIFVSDDWAQLEPVYGRPMPDTFTYTVEAGGKSVTTYDGADNPEVLDTALTQLNNLYVDVVSDQ